MSPNKDKALVVIFGGMAVMVVTTVCGAATGTLWRLMMNLVNTKLVDVRVLGKGVVGVPIWVWLGYMVCRNKNAAPNEVIPDDYTT